MGPTNFGTTVAQRLKHSIVRWAAQKLEVMQELRVCLPGIVQAFYPATQTVDVTVATNEYVWFTNSPSGPPNPNSPTLPTPLNIQTVAPQLSLLKGIPMFIPNGGGLMLTFPIQAGDECQVIFADTPLSGWLQNGGLNNLPFSQRRHSLTDGVAYFGARSRPNVLSDYSTASAQLRTLDGTTLVDVNPNGTVTITAKNIVINASSTGTIAMTGSSITFSNGTQTHDLFLHEHTGVQTGAGVSGGVNPVGP